MSRISFVFRTLFEALTIRPALCINAAEGPIGSVLWIVNTPDWLVVGFAIAVAMLGLRGATRLRATTLFAPCLWVTLSATCLAVLVLVQHQLEGIQGSALRFAIAATTLCPLMAVLGAKRPQNRGWQWVVLTLWIVLVWPAAQAVLLPAGIHVELFIAWKLFLWGLIALGLLNYLPTRHWFAAVFVAVGQVLLLREHLGLGSTSPPPPEWNQPSGIGWFLIAALVVNARGVNKATRDSQLAPLNSQWLSFRDSFGAFWALRILGRINHTAQLREWPLRLQWSGMVESHGRHAAESELEELDLALATLLRRFVVERREHRPLVKSIRHK